MVSLVILSRDYPEKVLEDLHKQTYQDFEILWAREKGIVKAMNKALDRARGDIFVRIDDDVELPPQWLAELVFPFSWSGIAGVTGPTFVPKDRRHNRDSIRFAENPKGLLRWLYDGNKFRPGGIRRCGCVSYDSNFQERFVLNRYVINDPDHLEGTNWAMRTELIRAAGGFDPKFDGVCEWFDADVEQKIKKRGWEFRYSSRAYLYHMLEKGDHYSDRFSGLGRIKNFLRFHWRHARWRFLHPKFYIYLVVWSLYFVSKRIKRG